MIASIEVLEASHEGETFACRTASNYHHRFLDLAALIE